MEKKNVNELHNLNGKSGEITIQHELYGNQRIKAKIHIINDGERVGVRIKNHEIFLWKNEIKDIQVMERFALIKGELMQITINI